MLKWIVERLENKAEAQDTAIGLTPSRGALDLAGLAIDDAQVDLLLDVDPTVWREEVALSRDYLETFGGRLPAALREEQRRVEQRLSA